MNLSPALHRSSRALLALCCAFALLQPALAAPPAARKAAPAAPQPVRDGEAEARLIEIYKLIGQAKTRAALSKAETLVRDHPNFQLAQLVYGDLLTAQRGPVRSFGDVPDAAAQSSA
ncbi:MAG TPA: hypothetical protein VIL30_08730, partial [Ramlibacter sp.]